MQPEAATVSITRHLDLRPSFGQRKRKTPRPGKDRGVLCDDHAYRGKEGMSVSRRGRGGSRALTLRF